MKRFFVILTYVVSVVMTLLCGLYFGVYALPDWHIALRVLEFIALATLGWVLAVYGHELGHKFFGWLCGFKVKISRDALKSPAASCAISPLTTKGLPYRTFFTVIGGILVNFGLMALGLLGFEVDKLIFLVPLIPANFYLFLLNLLPFHYATGKTDGYIANAILNGTDESKVMLAVLKVQAMVNGGTPFLEIPQELLFDVPVIQEDDEYFIELLKLRISFFEAKGEEGEANRWRDRLSSILQDE